MNGFIICNKLSKKCGKFFTSQPIFDCRVIYRHIHEISLFFMLPIDIEIILMR